MRDLDTRKAQRIAVASAALNGLLAAGEHGGATPDDLTGYALEYADILLRKIDATSRVRPGDTRTDLQRETQQAGIDKALQERADARLAGTPTLRELEVSGRACAPLERMGIVRIGDLVKFDRSDIAEVKGVSTETLAQLDGLLTDHDLSWGMGEDADVDEDGEGDEDEDIL